MSGLKRQIESLPPGLIIIRGRVETAEFMQELPRNILADLQRRGYRFLVVPEGLSIEHMPDEVIEELYLERQSLKQKVTAPISGGVH